jgi:peptide/nickel transport system permease protein
MLNFILFRLVLVVPIVLGATIVVFAIVQFAPGDPAQAVAGRYASQTEVDKLALEMGFRDPVPQQYIRWLGKAVSGDLGMSLEEKSPVFPILIERFANTLILAAASGFIAVVLGVSLGIIAALRQNSILDRVILFVSLFGLSMPAYWLGLVLIYLLVVQVQWFPSFGMYSTVGGGSVLDLLKHLALPAIAGSAVALGIIARTSRSAMLEVLRLDFMTGLRAKGLSEPAVWKHAFRNALPPITTMVGLQLAYLMLGTEIFVEIIFSWPGIGLQTFTAVFNRDVTMIQGIVVATTVIFVLMNLFVDILVLILNPRARHA